jgi:hypothetical protein
MALAANGLAAQAPVATQAELLLKAMAYDQNLAKRSGAAIHIAVIHGGDSTAAAAVVAAFLKAGAGGVAGLPVRAASTGFDSVQELLKRVDDAGYSAIYVHESAMAALSSIQQVTRGRKLMSIGATRRLVEQGLSLGVFMQGDVPRLVINERSARVEGLDLKPAVRLISHIIR